MLRSILAVAAVLALLAPSARADMAAAPVSLNKDVSIQADVVVLGDLFSGLPAGKADVPVAYAPKLGRSAILDAAWLAKVARQQGVDWRPSSRFERTTVERASQAIPYQVIEDAIREEMRTIEPDRVMDVRFDSRRTTLHIPRSAERAVEIRQFDYDARTGRFAALVVAPAGAPVAEAKVYGKTYEVAEIPVLSHRVTRGDVISKDDIQWLEVNAGRIGGNVVVDPERLVGMTPRRLLQPGVPVRGSDLEEPVAVTRGSYVTIAVRTDLMTLTVRGRAVENGSVGKPVQVMNIQSKQVVEAIVVDAGTVVVDTASSKSIN